MSSPRPSVPITDWQGGLPPMRPWLLLCGWLPVVLASGCGLSTSDKPVPVTGAVRLDQNPLPTGSVYFCQGGGVPPLEGKITDGKFRVLVPPGTYRVEFRAYRMMVNPPPRTSGAPIDPIENYLPARYHADSDLTAEVRAAGPNHLEFDLASR